MRQFLAGTFTTCVIQLEILRVVARNEAEWGPLAAQHLRELETCCKEMGFARLADRVNHLQQTLPEMDWSGKVHLLLDLTADIQRELTRHRFFLVHEPEWFTFSDGDRPMFNRQVDDVFPNAAPEIAEAGRCLALDRWTACVFHLMRAVETALHQWAEDLGAPLTVPASQSNMQEILNAADRKLREIGNLPRSAQRDADLEYFGETSAHFRALKDAWRNHVAHAKTTYDGRAARSAWNHVGDFMMTLAKRRQP
jgi:hypothetical protein